MEDRAGSEIPLSDRSLESQASGDLVPYEFLNVELEQKAKEVLPGWYARGAQAQEIENAPFEMQEREPAVAREPRRTRMLFNQLEARVTLRVDL